MAKVIEHRNALLGDSYYEVHHRTGLTILVYPKPGYSTSYAVIGTNYGSIDDALKVRGGEEKVLPWGTAHFLEHKLFESEELDAFERFAETGATPVTCSPVLPISGRTSRSSSTSSSTRTSPSRRWKRSRASSDRRSACTSTSRAGRFSSTCSNVFTTECYESFYNLNNMVLACAGNVTVDEVLDICDSALSQTEEVIVERPDKGEPADIVEPSIAQEFAVTIPTFALGFKETHETPIRNMKERILTDILMDVVAGESSELYERLLSEGLIDTGFGYEYFTGPGYATVIFEGRSRDPEKVAEAIKAEIRKLRETGVDPVVFDRLRKMNYGKTVMSYNDIDGLANGLVGAYMNGAELFEELDLYREITVEDANEQLKHQMLEEYCALSVVHGPDETI